MSEEPTYYRPGAATDARGTFDPFRALGVAEGPADLVGRVRKGFPATVVDQVAEELELTQQAILRLAGISPATFTRRRRTASRLLSVQESDRLYRIVEVYRQALALFEGDRQAARAWLKEPARALGGVSPLAYLDTEAGADAVRDLIGRLEHGVYA